MRVLFVLLILYIYIVYMYVCMRVYASSIATSVCVQLEMCFAACLADVTDNHAGFPFKPSSLMSLPESNAGELSSLERNFLRSLCVQVWLSHSPEIISLPGKKKKGIRFFCID